MALPISMKQAVEIFDFIRGRKIDDAKKLLEKVVNQEMAIPFKRFNQNMGHKRKIGPGRYPQKASREIIKLLESLSTNAQFKGLNTSNLIIKKICATNASITWHYGRKRRRKMKRTNMEIIAEESGIKDKEAKEKTEAKIKKTSDNKLIVKEEKKINDKK